MMCYKTTIDNKKAYLYFLLEHQSKPDPLMPFRLLKYPIMYTTPLQSKIHIDFSDYFALKFEII
ncbi:TPA: Rpn family recombination-promoting nuclease/putative transposase [Legionella pneumophila]|nr:Rpn family recombination-promoting nuclease/putative transposase [Legionella pneumophila]